MLIIKPITDELLRKYSEEISEFYDIETLTDDKIEREIRKLHQRGERLNEVLAMMERVEGKHPDLMKFYADRDVIMKKIYALQKFCSHRRNLRIKEIQKKKKIYYN